MLSNNQTYMGMPAPVALIVGPILGGLFFLALPVLTMVAAVGLAVQRLARALAPQY